MKRFLFLFLMVMSVFGMARSAGYSPDAPMPTVVKWSNSKGSTREYNFTCGQSAYGSTTTIMAFFNRGNLSAGAHLEGALGASGSFDELEYKYERVALYTKVTHPDKPTIYSDVLWLDYGSTAPLERPYMVTYGGNNYDFSAQPTIATLNPQYGKLVTFHNPNQYTFDEGYVYPVGEHLVSYDEETFRLISQNEDGSVTCEVIAKPTMSYKRVESQVMARERWSHYDENTCFSNSETRVYHMTVKEPDTNVIPEPGVTLVKNGSAYKVSMVPGDGTPVYTLKYTWKAYAAGKSDPVNTGEITAHTAEIDFPADASFIAVEASDPQGYCQSSTVRLLSPSKVKIQVPYMKVAKGQIFNNSKVNVGESVTVVNRNRYNWNEESFYIGELGYQCEQRWITYEETDGALTHNVTGKLTTEPGRYDVTLYAKADASNGRFSYPGIFEDSDSETFSFNIRRQFDAPDKIVIGSATVNAGTIEVKYGTTVIVKNPNEAGQVAYERVAAEAIDNGEFTETGDLQFDVVGQPGNTYTCIFKVSANQEEKEKYYQSPLVTYVFKVTEPDVKTMPLPEANFQRDGDNVKVVFTPGKDCPVNMSNYIVSAYAAGNPEVLGTYENKSKDYELTLPPNTAFVAVKVSDPYGYCADSKVKLFRTGSLVSLGGAYLCVDGKKLEDGCDLAMKSMLRVENPNRYEWCGEDFYVGSVSFTTTQFSLSEAISGTDGSVQGVVKGSNYGPAIVRLQTEPTSQYGDIMFDDVFTYSPSEDFICNIVYGDELMSPVMCYTTVDGYGNYDLRIVAFNVPDGGKVRYWLYKNGESKPVGTFDEVETENYVEVNTTIEAGKADFVKAAVVIEGNSYVKYSEPKFASMGDNKADVATRVTGVYAESEVEVPGSCDVVVGSKLRFYNFMAADDNNGSVPARIAVPIVSSDPMCDFETGDNYIDVIVTEDMKNFMVTMRVEEGLEDVFEYTAGSMRFNVIDRLPVPEVNVKASTAQLLAVDPKAVLPAGAEYRFARFAVADRTLLDNGVSGFTGNTIGGFKEFQGDEPSFFMVRVEADGFAPTEWVSAKMEETGKSELSSLEVLADGEPVESGCCLKPGTVVTVINPNILLLCDENYLVSEHTLVFEGDEPADLVKDDATGNYTFTVEDGSAFTRAKDGERSFTSTMSTVNKHSNVFTASQPVTFTYTVGDDVETGVTGIEAETNGEVKIFTVDGLSVGKEGLKPGVYIIVKDGKAEKRLIRK